jgi:hypothetical protein
VSSDYRILCMTHDPAIVIGHDWTNAPEAIAAACDPANHEAVAAHKDCDLLVGRYSYPLVEVCCPAGTGKWAHNTHLAPQWIATDWLRLLHQAVELNDPALASSVKTLVGRGCWSAQRLRRLRDELGCG